MKEVAQRTGTDEPEFCQECGASIEAGSEFCTSCGNEVASTSASDDDGLVGETGYLAIGGGSGLVALILLPPIFGLISVACGIQLYRHHDERYGIAIIAFGIVATILGMIIGAMVATGRL